MLVVGFLLQGLEYTHSCNFLLISVLGLSICSFSLAESFLEERSYKR